VVAKTNQATVVTQGERAQFAGGALVGLRQDGQFRAVWSAVDVRADGARTNVALPAAAMKSLDVSEGDSISISNVL